MMTKGNNATCSICGSEYYACFSCADAIKLQPWKLHCCSSSHFQVFQAVRGLSTGVYTKDEFKSKLKNINLDDINSFRPHIKRIIEDALKEDILVEDVVEQVQIEEETENPVEIETTTEEKVIIERPIYSRKKNFK